jgi:radical SAM protein with 4Fe4S-binding SPASM domain
MSRESVSALKLPSWQLWDRIKDKRIPLSFNLELTARCNNNCRHCYVNLPAGDREARSRELSLEEILRIGGEAVDLGALWCLVTGGEPLLRQDFFDLYLGLKRLGLLLSVFTNACLVSADHVKLFKHYPPRDLEVTVYGVTRETYEAVTRKPGSFAAFRRGLALMLDSGLKVHLKTMALRANLHELPEIARFCRAHTRNYFRFDPLLHLRYDGNRKRNAEIEAQRLSPEEIVALEKADPERWPALQKNCGQLIAVEVSHGDCDYLFHCGAGLKSFTVSWSGSFRLCDSLCDPACVYDLRQGKLRQAWEELVPAVRDRRCRNAEFLAKCQACPLVSLCLWCPAHAYLETGRQDAWVEYFCRVAQARARSLGFKAYQNGS